MPACQLLNAGLQVHDGLIDGDVEGKERDSVLGQVVTRLLGKHRGDGMKAATGVFCHQRLADSTLAAPIPALVSA